MEPIGWAESCYKEKFGTPRQPGLASSSSAKIRVHSKWQPELSLEGLSEFSHIWVIYLFHENTHLDFQGKIAPPRLSGQKVGLFASRSPHRPNPIGLSLVKLEKVDRQYVYVSGIDFIEKTPILDIKPYIKEVESLPYSKSGWVEGLEDTKLEVQVETNLPPAIKQVVVDTLSRDVRPSYQKNNEDTKVYSVRFDNYDVKFRYNSLSSVTVLDCFAWESDGSN